MREVHYVKRQLVQSLNFFLIVIFDLCCNLPLTLEYLSVFTARVKVTPPTAAKFSWLLLDENSILYIHTLAQISNVKKTHEVNKRANVIDIFRGFSKQNTSSD